MANNVARLLIELEAKGAKDADRKLNGLAKQLEKVKRQATQRGLSEELVRLGQAAANSGDSVEDLQKRLNKIGASTKQIDKATEAFERQKRAIDEAAAASKKANDRYDRTSKSVGSLGDVQSNLGATSGLLGAFGGAGAAQGVAVAGEIAALTEELPRLSAAFKAIGPGLASLGVSAGAAAAAIGGATLALVAVAKAWENFTRITNNGKAALSAAVDSQLRYYEQVRTLDREQAQARLTELQGQLDSYTRVISELQARNAQLSRLEKLQTGNAVSKEIDERVKAYEALQDEIQKLQGGLIAGAFAAADTAEETETLAKIEQDLAAARQRQTDQLIDARRQILEFTAGDIGVQDVQRRVDSLEAERSSIMAVINESELSQEAQEEYAKRIETIDAQLKILNGTSLERARTLDAEKAAQEKAAAVQEAFQKRLQDIAEFGRRASDLSAKASEDAAKAQKKLADATRDLADDLNETLADLARGRDEDIRKSNQKLNSDLAELAQDRADSLRKIEQRSRDATEAFNRDEAKRRRDHLKTLADIQSQAEQDTQDAAARLDASALFAAQQESTTATQQENERFTEEQAAAQQELELTRRELQRERDEINRNYQQRREQLIANNRQEIAEIQRQYEMERAEAQANARKRLAELREQYREEQAERRRAYAQQLQELREQFGMQNNVAQQGFNLLARAAQRFAQAGQTSARTAESAVRSATNNARQAASIVEQARGLAARAASGLRNLFNRRSQPRGRVRGRATGGVMEAGQTYEVGEQGRELLTADRRMMVLNNATTERIQRVMNAPSMNISMPITINGNADSGTVSQIEAVVNRQINQATKELLQAMAA